MSAAFYHSAYLVNLAEVAILFMKIGRALQTVKTQDFSLAMHIVINTEKQGMNSVKRKQMCTAQHNNTCPESPEQVSEMSQSFTL